jgi:hypothetical protein
VVDAAPWGGQPRSLGVPLQAQRLARNPEPEFHFGADGHPLDEGPQEIREKRIALVAAVEAYFAAE